MSFNKNTRVNIPAIFHRDLIPKKSAYSIVLAIFFGVEISLGG